MASVFTALQYITSVNDSSQISPGRFRTEVESDDTATQFELNRKFAHTHNPDDESMAAGPGIYDNYKRHDPRIT
jgi:hypothetical protein